MTDGEEPKPAGERGKYMNPDAYGKPETMGISCSPKPDLGE